MARHKWQVTSGDDAEGAAPLNTRPFVVEFAQCQEQAKSSRIRGGTCHLVAGRSQTRRNNSGKAVLSPLAIFSMFTSDTLRTPRSIPL